MTEIAIIYASSLGGHVRDTAKYMAGRLGADQFDLKTITKINMDEYGRIIFGTPIHAGKPNKKVVDFIANNREALSKKKTSLFLCCMYGGEKGAAQCEAVSKDLGISDAAFFQDKGEKNEDGINKDVEAFIARMKA